MTSLPGPAHFASLAVVLLCQSMYFVSVDLPLLAFSKMKLGHRDFVAFGIVVLNHPRSCSRLTFRDSFVRMAVGSIHIAIFPGQLTKVKLPAYFSLRSRCLHTCWSWLPQIESCKKYGLHTSLSLGYDCLVAFLSLALKSI